MPTVEPQALSAQLVAPQDPVAYWTTAADDLTKNLAVHENVLLISMGSAIASTLYLPDVSLAKGQHYTIRIAATAGGGAELTVKTPQLLSTPIIQMADGELAYTIDGLTAADDLLVLYSDGYHWILLIDEST